MLHFSQFLINTMLIRTLDLLFVSSIEFNCYGTFIRIIIVDENRYL